VDERDVVYLSSAPAVSQREHAEMTVPDDALYRVAVDPVLLFRFSALTYNAHRIHYDLPYAQQVEGYPNLVVHGPLQALLMAEAAASLVARPLESNVTMSYSLNSPLFLSDGLLVHAGLAGPNVEASVSDNAGRISARATIEHGMT
jgi:Uncharacterized conserved protein